MDLSVIIVNYNVKYFLEQALRSISKAAAGLKVEYFVVDNASTDGSAEYIKDNFPWVRLIANKENFGFARANNQALKLTQGRYILVVNPDTLVGEETLNMLLEHMDSHPDIGAIGPKMVDREGRFELGCRRGFPTPFAAFSKITGLAALLPRSKLFAKYNLTYLDIDTPCEVDALSGAFMLVRRQAYKEVGGFDEQFFMYGEDLDWCYRIKLAGWKIFYLPAAEVIHYKGESTLRSNINARRAFFGAMRLFVKKHYSGKFTLTVFFIRLGIVIGEALNWLKRASGHLKGPLADLVLLNLGLALGWIIRFGPEAFFDHRTIPPLTVYNIGWVVIFIAFGVYGRKKDSVATTLLATLAGMAFIFTFTYFFKQFAFSRFVMLFTGIVTVLTIPGWRWLLLKFPHAKMVREWFRRRTLLVGVDELTKKIAARACSDERSPFKVVGFIECEHHHFGEKIAGVEVIGSAEELPQLIKRMSIEEVVFSGRSLSYGEILKHISGFKGRVGFKVVPESALESSNGEVPFLELGFIRKPNILHRLREKE